VAEIFSLRHPVQTDSGANRPHIQWVPGNISVGVKRPGREPEQSPPSSAEIMNAWCYTSTAHTSSLFGSYFSTGYVFMAW